MMHIIYMHVAACFRRGHRRTLRLAAYMYVRPPADMAAMDVARRCSHLRPPTYPRCSKPIDQHCDAEALLRTPYI